MPPEVERLPLGKHEKGAALLQETLALALTSADLELESVNSCAGEVACSRRAVPWIASSGCVGGANEPLYKAAFSTTRNSATKHGILPGGGELLSGDPLPPIMRESAVRFVEAATVCVAAATPAT